jgi:2-polyprenyl-3-methyl-5-hydroxy-6-metoxy-1,4-benzoquinol methylase
VEPADQQFVPHPVVWTRDKSQRWWDASTSGSAFHQQYFSKIFGDPVLRFVESAGVPLDGRVLDFGCGPGYLLEKLAAKGVDCHGVEFSTESAESARARLRSQGSAGTVEVARGIPTHLPGGSFDLVFFLETLEHLLEEERTPTVAELGRLLRPGGTLVVTVPNREDLDRAEVLCPDCGGRFHPMQHVSSWSSSSLVAVMGGHGFEAVKCEQLTLHRRWLMGKARTLASNMLGRIPPNLVFIGRRTRR